ncbi:MAG: M20/M25/M40 family metallo-hydrolase [Armatimonadota bacterium]|nr:M20/M25/M40 family metallo-hydrolase [Armatimonadota bacterium]
MDGFDAYVADNQARFVAELQAFCRLPSVAAEGRAVAETADAVAARLAQAGAAARVVPVPGGSPVVLGEVGRGPRTLLIYGHYDVQPADPLAEWHSDPFGAEARDGRVYARGVSDNKGPVMARIQAVEAYRHAAGDLPVRVRFLIEGEEEIGSPHLAAFVEAHLADLRADLALWEGNGRDATGRPMGSLGQKGLASFNVRLRTARQDQHSMWGTLVPNALWRMVWALGTLKDPEDRITIEGLSDQVRSPGAAELALLDRIPFDDDRIHQQFGIRGFVRGLRGRDALRRHLFEPACTINGLWGGYTGPGGKTVLPAEAQAKIEIRLVPDLTPDLVARLLRVHLDRAGFADVELEPVDRLTPFRCRPDHPLVAEALAAAEETYGEPVALYPTSPGSGPMFQVCGPLQIPGISIGGMNHAGANIHGPNENIFISDYLLGIRFAGRLFARLGGTR